MLAAACTHLGGGDADLVAGVQVHTAVGGVGDGGAHRVGDAHTQCALGLRRTAQEAALSKSRRACTCMQSKPLPLALGLTVGCSVCNDKP